VGCGIFVEAAVGADVVFGVFVGATVGANVGFFVGTGVDGFI
jgi:hypothetical protein